MTITSLKPLSLEVSTTVEKDVNSALHLFAIYYDLLNCKVSRYLLDKGVSTDYLNKESDQSMVKSLRVILLSALKSYFGVLVCQASIKVPRSDIVT